MKELPQLHLKMDCYGDTTDIMDQLAELTGFWISVNDRLKTQEERSMAGHQSTDMIQECIFEGRACNPFRDFLPSYQPLYGNCYTFNSGLPRGSTSRHTKLTGPLRGLTLTLWLQAGEYMGDLAPSAGLRVVVHEPGTLPFPGEEGLDIPPGYETTLAVKLEVTKRQGTPYGNCSDRQDKETMKYLDLKKPKYTLKTCHMSCRTRKMLRHCGCAHPFFAWEAPAPLKTCGNFTEMQCADDIQFGKRDGCGCSCQESCVDYQYKHSLSQSLWPSDGYVSKFMHHLLQRTKSGALKHEYFHFQQLYENKLVNTLGGIDQILNANDTNRIRKDFLQLNVHMTDLHYQTIETRKSYGILKLLSDIGGQMGLWVGFSVLTILEFVELLLEMGHGFLCKKKSSNAVRAKPRKGSHM